MDPEDLVYDILQGMGEKTKEQTKDQQEASEIQVTLQQVLNEPMDLDEMICRSICTIENDELRKRLANQIILVGGPCKSHKMIEMLEQTVISKMQARFDETIERVEVILCNIQQQQAYLL